MKMPRIHIAVRHFAAPDPAGIATLLTLLTPEDQHGLSPHLRIRQRQQLARAWRRQLLGAALDMAPAELIFAHSGNGKPFLPRQGLRFNLSHSREAFALAWTQNELELGIDIEDRARRLRAAVIAAASFSPAEKSAWENSHDAQETWLTIWTRKEALLKCTGLGMRMDLTQLDTCATDKEGFFQQAAGERQQVQSWCLPKQILSLAWTCHEPRPHITLDAPAFALPSALLPG